MKIHSFKGGIHPKEMKELTNQCKIIDAFPKSKIFTVPVTMGGAVNNPLVKSGDLVSKGQIIANGEQFLSCPVHSPVSGKVLKIQNCMITGNQEVPCIIIQSDEEDRTDFMEPLDPFTCDFKLAIERIKNAGITGMGGASFPSHVKLNPPADKKIDYVILNAAECEPYLTCDERLLIEQTNKVIDGLSIVLRLVNARGIVALEKNKEYLKPLIFDAIINKGLEDKISICVVKTKYPQGSEKFIISACLKVEIPSAKLPADAGAMVCNVGTVCAISDAFRLGKPLISRVITISGNGVLNPCNLSVPIGTLISDLIPDYFEFDCENSIKVISGGPMMGFSMASESFPVTKGTSGVIFLTNKEIKIEEEDQCISCGSCISNCPMHINPVLMLREMKSENYNKAKKFGLMDCIECGCCAFVCPAHINLVTRFRLGKQIFRQLINQQNQKKS